ncbi:DNRLRE domain-containing protein [Dehalobacter sp. TBBPA1]|uniref:CBM96 family carbohydrate-binding protein n=1 Tax=Dehalobacter sp. TBBPA1 TaxID=3235037 RepID=UPI0034A46B9B
MSVTMDEKLEGSVRIPVAKLDSVNTAYDEDFGGLLILEQSGQSLVLVPTGTDGKLQPSMLTRQNIQSWRLKKPKGMTVDHTGKQIFILDLSGPSIIKITPAGSKGLENASITTVDLRQLGILKPHGLAFDSATGHLHLFSQDNQTLYEIAQSGEIVATRNLSTFKLTNLKALVFAPSFDQTDNPQQTSLYLADSSRIIELSLYEPVVMAASTFSSVLYHTIDTSSLTPPSPDPCGIEYLPSSNTLLFCDSEVDEMTNLWANANLFETTLSGTIVRTSNIRSFTKEPTGIAYNPANGHMFISEDDGHRIFEVAPGKDGFFGTSDDTRSVFMTSYFGSNDPEGVAFDSSSNTLFIVDGVNEEVYLIKPGINGQFDGVPPYGDDLVTNFDTTILGVHDPEGIGFCPATGHLYISDTASRTVVAEVTVAGTLEQTIDISAASARKLSGIGFGPSSTDPASVAMYVTDRGVDNNVDPNENDGKIYELSIPTNNNAPTVSIIGPVNGASYMSGDAINFSGSASDTEDGNLSASMTWTSSIDGLIGNGSSFNVSNLTIGTHTITTTVSDSNGVSSSASVTVSVDPIPQISKFTPTDDAKVSSINPNKNYGSITTLEVRKSTYTLHSYLKFNVTGLSGTMKNAKIRVYSVASSRDGGSIYAVSNNYNGTSIPWLESGLTYNNAPSIIGEPLSTKTKVTIDSWVDYDVTAAITGNGEYSFALANISSQYTKYNSSEASLNLPELVIEME